MHTNVKIIVVYFNGQMRKDYRRAMSEHEIEKLICWDSPDNGKIKSVSVFVEGKLYADWRVERGQSVA